MVSQFLADLEPTISLARLQRYQSATGDDLETAVNYLWNMALSESFYCSLSAVEIALRNGLHDTLTVHFGTPNWYDQKGLLDRKQVDNVIVVKKRIRRGGASVTPDRVVSELSFGFWVTILSRNYNARLWQGQNAAPLRHAFPHIPRRLRQRQPIHQHYNAIRELRNRVFHHDPSLTITSFAGVTMSFIEESAGSIRDFWPGLKTLTASATFIPGAAVRW